MKRGAPVRGSRAPPAFPAIYLTNDNKYYVTYWQGGMDRRQPRIPDRFREFPSENLGESRKFSTRCEIFKISSPKVGKIFRNRGAAGRTSSSNRQKSWQLLGLDSGPGTAQKDHERAGRDRPKQPENRQKSRQLPGGSGAVFGPPKRP